MGFLYAHLLLGLMFSILGVVIHARAWGISKVESFEASPFMWIVGGMWWPLALNLLLKHEGM